MENHSVNFEGSLKLENLDSIFKQYSRKWLEVPISGSLSNIYLTSNKLVQNITPSPLQSIKFIQRQKTVQSFLPARCLEITIYLTREHLFILFTQK